MSIFYFPTAQAYGINIKPFHGAKIYFYDAGTDTPKASYTTDAETVAHDWPVVADINGRFPAIYISGTYKIVITDRNGEDSQTFDNLQGRTGNLQDKGTFTSTTNGGDFPAAGSLGDWYRVAETFVLNTTSGSHVLFDGDFIQCNKNGATGIDADWDIVLGVNSRQKQADFSSKNLIIRNISITRIDVDADVLNVINSSGQVKRLTGVDLTFTMPTDILNGTEKASHWYDMWTDENGLHKLTAQLTGTADANVPNSLSASAMTFVTDGVEAGYEIFQTTDKTKGFVGAVSSETVLTCVDADGNALDLFPAGTETFIIKAVAPTGLGNFPCKPGSVYNNAAGNFVDSFYTKPDGGKEYNDVDDFLVTGTAGFSMVSGIIVAYQTNNWHGLGTWHIKGNITYTCTSTASPDIAISGTTNPAYNQAGWVYPDSSNWGKTRHNPNSTTITVALGTATTIVHLGFDIKQSVKPTWAI